MMKTKYIVLVHAGKISTEEISKKICEELGIEKSPEPYYGGVGYRNEKGELDFSFLNLEDGMGKITITTSDNTIRQINLAILRGSLEKANIDVPKRCKKVKGINYEEVEAYWFWPEGKIEQLEVTETGIIVPKIDEWIEEMNLMMEDMYYTLKYGTKE